MSNASLNIDPRIIPLVRTLKEQNVKSPDLPTKVINQDLSSEKTSENSVKAKVLESKKIIENEKNKVEDKKHKTITKYNNINNRTNTMIKKYSNTKISIDGSAENKIKSGTSDNNHRGLSQSHKIKIISKPKEKENIHPTNTFQSSTGQLKQKKFNNIKTRSKYVQNLLNDMSIKKYKASCIDILKNDNLVKKLKLEMLFLDESNFIKKNFKENFFKKEIVKYLNEYNSQDEYQKQVDKLKDVFKEGFESILNFDLFHD